MVEMGERAVIPAEKGRGLEVAERPAEAGPAILQVPTASPAPMELSVISRLRQSNLF